MFGKEKTFQEVTGYTEDEFKAKVGEVDTLKTKNTELESKLSTMETEFTFVKDQLKALQSPPEPPKPGAPSKLTDFYVDPDKAFAERMAPLAQHTLQTNASLEALRAEGRHQREYQLWGKEIREIADKHPDLAQRGTAEFYDNVIAMVKGRHTDEILEAERKGQSLFTEPGSGAHVGGSVKDETFGLSRAQLDSAKRLNMTPEEFSTQYNSIMEARGVRIGSA